MSKVLGNSNTTPPNLGVDISNPIEDHKMMILRKKLEYQIQMEPEEIVKVKGLELAWRKLCDYLESAHTYFDHESHTPKIFKELQTIKHRYFDPIK